jgi:hypothetical protein
MLLLRNRKKMLILSLEMLNLVYKVSMNVARDILRNNFMHVANLPKMFSCREEMFVYVT